MTVEQLDYMTARSRMKAGDVIAFGGKGHLSEIIKLATFSAVSHVGTVLQTQIPDDNSGRFFNLIIESTYIDGCNGVSISRLSDRLDAYVGELWWLPLSDVIRQAKFNQQAFFDFLFDKAQRRIEYDTPQAIKSALDALDRLPLGMHGPTYNHEDFGKFFCSELVAAGLEKAGSVGKVNSAEVTPIDLCRWQIYQDKYYQLKGNTDKQISRFNTLSPAAWDD
ncbi:MAG: hypothetical protein GY881_13465 [Gammaproteobacteria bacterium]|nr:hypothetical protein [Gammaproteobacteria bacterium]